MSDSLTIRVSRSTHELLRDLATRSNAPMSALVDEAVQDLKRKRFWAEFNAAAAALEADPKAWADHQNEDEAWANTLADGLETASHGVEEGRSEPGAR
jgi:predicted transcriptional regulator